MDVPAQGSTFSIVWLLGLLLLFVGILYWAFRPKNKRRFEKDARIPLRDDDPPSR